MAWFYLPIEARHPRNHPRMPIVRSSFISTKSRLHEPSAALFLIYGLRNFGFALSLLARELHSRAEDVGGCTLILEGSMMGKCRTQPYAPSPILGGRLGWG